MTPQKHEPFEYLTVPQIAKRFGVSNDAMRRLLHENQVPAFNLSRVPRYRADVIAEFEKARTFVPKLDQAALKN